jgi:WD40 repeat protein
MACLQVVSQLQVHGVYALSRPSKAVVAACPAADHLVASAANSFAVIHDASTDEQVHLLRSTTSNQPLQCLAWSCCGTYLAAGEGGNNPTIIVWEVSSGRCAQELKGHRSTIGQLCFSPDGKKANKSR